MTDSLACQKNTYALLISIGLHWLMTLHQVDGDRGRWLYRGYLVGNAHGNLAGRWRDTLSPPDVSGYEGCFAMNRRR